MCDDTLESLARRSLDEDEVSAEDVEDSSSDEEEKDSKREKKTDGKRKRRDEESGEDGVSREEKMAAKKEERLTELFLEVYTQEYCTSAGSDVAALVSGLVEAMATKKEEKQAEREEALVAKVNAMTELALSKCVGQRLLREKERK